MEWLLLPTDRTRRQIVARARTAVSTNCDCSTQENHPEDRDRSHTNSPLRSETCDVNRGIRHSWVFLYLSEFGWVEPSGARVTHRAKAQTHGRDREEDGGKE